MSVTYNELTKSIDIKDGLKSSFSNEVCNDTYQCSFEYIKWSNSIYESVMVGFRNDFSVVILHKYILKNQVARRYPLIKSKVSMKALFRSKKYFI
jgi:hypothetical protein